MSKGIAISLFVLVLVLSACTGAPTPAAQPAATQAAPAQPAATQAPVVTQAPAATQPPAVTQPPAQPTAASAPATTAPEPTQPPAGTQPPAQPAATSAAAAPVGQAVVYHIAPGDSQVSYAVGETFFNQNNRFNLAVGVTAQVQGDVTLDSSAPKNAQIGPLTIDISQFKSDSSRRDNAIRGNWLESSTYPTATFSPTQIDGLPDTYAEGQEISFKVTGDLTVKQTTKPVTFDVTAKLQNGVLTGTAVATISLNDFGVGPIEIGGILKTEDQAKLTLTFVARP